MTKKTTDKGKAKAPAKAKSTAKTKATAKKSARSGVAPDEPAVAAPVTLEEAQALARARHPMRAARRTTVPPPTPATVGEERERLERERRAERARRVREYKDTMAIMKRRGVRRPRAAATPGRRRAAGSAVGAFKPLQVMAEGDSWFDYPYPAFGGGIIKRLQARLGVPILNMADAGDEVRFMLGVEQRKRLVETLKKGCPAGGPWEVVLFSGGGNDIVDNPMALWIREWQAGATPANLIHQPRFDATLALVRAGYEDLIELRNQLSAETHLVFHAYDFAFPDGRGACHLGPWMKPTFDLRGFPNQAAAFPVVKTMLQQFALMLSTLTAHPRVTVIGTQGTLAPQASSWHNELHPAKAGFEKFADLFQQHLKTLFPSRVL